MNNKEYEKYQLETPFIIISFFMFFVCMWIAFLLYTNPYIFGILLRTYKTILHTQYKMLDSYTFLFAYALVIIIPSLIWFIIISIFVEPLYVAYRIKDTGFALKEVLSRLLKGLLLIIKWSITLIATYFFYKMFIKYLISKFIDLSNGLLILISIGLIFNIGKFIYYLINKLCSTLIHR